jgi:probable O-glycosylation ligase (exosortase A-associated)
MLRSLYLSGIYLAFFVLGWNAPFVLALGYLWVDTFNPQAVGGGLLGLVPLSLIMAVATLGSFIVMQRNKGRVTALTVLLLLFAIWVTLTTAIWAEVPVSAWEKWNYAFKMLCFAAFLPFILRSRIQIEAMLQVYVFALAIHYLPVGVKTMISGGGYGVDLGVIGGNSLLSEGATLAGVALMIIPVILFLRRHSLIVPRHPLIQLGYGFLASTALMAAIGTYERTAVIGIGVLAIGMWLRSKRKLLHGVLGTLVLLGIASTTSDAWNKRISTIGHYNTEGSANGRILVWEWTFDYANQHPLGGGFNSYKIDRIVFPPETPDGDPVVKSGIAFHSIYFEVLGEQGYVGLGLFFIIIILSLFQLQKVAGLTKHVEEMAWARDLAFSLQVSLVTLLACGSFIGIAFQPMLYYLFALATCLREHVREVQRQGNLPAPAPKPSKYAAFVPAQ